MRKNSIVAAILFLGILGGFAQNSKSGSSHETRKEKVMGLLKEYTSQGLPGIGVAFWSKKEGLWVHTEGYSNLEYLQPLDRDQLFYLQSVSKTYMAVAILALAEDGRLQLDDPISKYLNVRDLGTLGQHGITVRMLLNHTSGIPDYASDEGFVSYVMQNLTKPFEVDDCLAYAKNKHLDFQPLSDYAYSNTNYVLLSMIADRITGDHVEFIKTRIFERLGLSNTHYLTPAIASQVPGIVDAYWDPLNLERPVNVTAIQKTNVSSLKGDDGIVCSLEDGITFLKGLMEGDLLGAESLNSMKKWVEKDGVSRYGLGLTYYPLGNSYGIGHSGGGLGAGCILIYVPEFDSYVFMATNFSTMIESKITLKCQNLVQEVLQALFF